MSIKGDRERYEAELQKEHKAMKSTMTEVYSVLDYVENELAYELEFNSGKLDICRMRVVNAMKKIEALKNKEEVKEMSNETVETMESTMKAMRSVDLTYTHRLRDAVVNSMLEVLEGQAPSEKKYEAAKMLMEAVRRWGDEFNDFSPF